MSLAKYCAFGVDLILLLLFLFIREYGAYKICVILSIVWFVVKSLLVLQLSISKNWKSSTFKSLIFLYGAGLVVALVVSIMMKREMPFVSPLNLFFLTQVNWSSKGPGSIKYVTVLLVSFMFWFECSYFISFHTSVFVIANRIMMMFIPFDPPKTVTESSEREFMGTDRSIKDPLLLLYVTLILIFSVSVSRNGFINSSKHVSGISTIFLGLIFPKDSTLGGVAVSHYIIGLGLVDLCASYLPLDPSMRYSYDQEISESLWKYLFVSMGSSLVHVIYFRRGSLAVRALTTIQILFNVVDGIILLSMNPEYYSTFFRSIAMMILTSIFLWLHEKDIVHEIESNDRIAATSSVVPISQSTRMNNSSHQTSERTTNLNLNPPPYHPLM